jgi:hypothetical protein
LTGNADAKTALDLDHFVNVSRSVRAASVLFSSAIGMSDCIHRWPIVLLPNI